jgi:hypothetical protein
MNTAAVFDRNEGHLEFELCGTKKHNDWAQQRFPTALLLTLYCCIITTLTETMHTIVARLVCGCSMADAGTVRTKPCMHMYREHQIKTAMH